MNNRSVKDFFSGFKFILKGFQTLKEHPQLKKWVVVPLCIDVFVFIFGLVFIGGFIQGWVVSASAGITGMLSFLSSAAWLYNIIYYPLIVLVWIVFFLLWIYLTFVVGTVLASPFNALLAERTLIATGAISEQKFKFSSWFIFTVKMMGAALVKAVVFALFGIVIFVMSFIPGLNLVASFSALLIVAFDCCDYGFEVLGMPFGKRLGYFSNHLVQGSGMASCLFFTLLIPGSTLLVLPFGVIGASRLLAEGKVA